MFVCDRGCRLGIQTKSPFRAPVPAELALGQQFREAKAVKSYGNPFVSTSASLQGFNFNETIARPLSHLLPNAPVARRDDRARAATFGLRVTSAGAPVWTRSQSRGNWRTQGQQTASRVRRLRGKV